MQTLYWHDYETFGTDPQRDRPVQFAGIRTDSDFNIIEDPLTLYCKPSEDYLPHPDACAITGITPQFALANGVPEAEFIKQIHAKLATPNTCTLGYNSLRFDDEVTRNTLYRNFYDPYAREWQNGNSRWDLIDVVRAARALRPEGINWPWNETEGKPSFKLEELTRKNGISHQDAHDALADVYATIEFAKLLKRAQPRLYEFLWQHRVKHEVLKLLNLGAYQPLVHISGMYPALKHCLAIVLPLIQHPTDTNGIVVYDLSIEPEPLIELPAHEIQHRIFTAVAELPEGVERIPLKTVHINRCPVLAPLNVIKSNDVVRLEIDLEKCLANLAKIKASSGIIEKLQEVFANNKSKITEIDPDLSIYSGGFFSDSDRQQMLKIRSSTPEQLGAQAFTFKDRRLAEMLFRYRARNFPETLSQPESLQWTNFCKERLTSVDNKTSLTLENYFSRLTELRNTANVDHSLLNELESYAHLKMQKLGLALP
jgi:exodeoxyribonuclease I